jgi:hypothetical protein
MKPWPDCGTPRFDLAAELVETIRQYVDTSYEDGNPHTMLRHAEDVLTQLREIEDSLSVDGAADAHHPSIRSSISSALQEWRTRYDTSLAYLNAFRAALQKHRGDIEALYQVCYTFRRLLHLVGSIDARLKYVVETGLDARARKRKVKKDRPRRNGAGRKEETGS